MQAWRMGVLACGDLRCAWPLMWHMTSGFDRLSGPWIVGDGNHPDVATPVDFRFDRAIQGLYGWTHDVMHACRAPAGVLVLVTSHTKEVSHGSLGEQESVSLDVAFRIMTENGATLMGHRDTVGSIEVGMQADVIVTATNPFESPITQVHKTSVKMTFIKGEKVFDLSSPPKLTAN